MTDPIRPPARPEAGPLRLVADVGGTNTRVALAQGDRVLTGTVRRYPNKALDEAGAHRFPDIGAVLRAYVAEEGCEPPEATCVAAAGPVEDGAVRMTNIEHWPVIDGAALARATGSRTVAVLNDLQAQGHALGHVDPAHLRPILPFPEAKAGAAMLVIGVGTGFNAAPVFAVGGRRVIPASESGHVSLPVHSEEDARLAAWLARNLPRHRFASVEEVLSGRGIAQVYAWLSDEDGDRRRLGSEAILAAAQAGDVRAERALQVASRMLGVVAGNLALTQLPYGGIWLVGGLARALGPTLLEFGFEEGFTAKGRFSGFMRRFGVGIVEDDFAALTGCASYLAMALDAEGA